MNTIAPHELDARYPTSQIRGDRITRLGETYLGAVATDVATCRSLGEEHIGWFIGGLRTYDRMIEHARQINKAQVGGRWIVVPATRHLAEIAYDHWFESESSDRSSEIAMMWHDELVTFCVPERLGELGPAIQEQNVPVAGIILLDPNCMIHRGRSFSRGTFRVAHDRPQLIVNFRSKLGVGSWSPPLFIMSRRHAAAVLTDSVARVYGLEAMHFIDGSVVRCGNARGSSTKIAVCSTQTMLVATHDKSIAKRESITLDY